MKEAPRLKRWFEHRTGAGAGLRHFMYESIPASTGWRNTLGSLAGALLLVQILTGFLLALYYVPHPEAAYESIEYVENAITLGWFVRALHYWGVSFIVIALFLHMIRVFYTGAYRAPRELTWVIGVLLLGVTLALAFTGQILPWNQMGYWAANIGVEIASSTPIIGQEIRTLMLGGDTIGALTLTRFYALHVVLLPALLGLLVLGHLYLLRRHGPMRTPKDPSNATVSFFPSQVARDLMVITAGLVLLGAAAYWYGGPDVGPLDPDDTAFQPHPEWYFLAHYQLLRFMPGPLKIVATFVIPSIVMFLMLGLPWFDRKTSAPLRDRPVIVGAGSFLITAVVGLTLFGVATLPSGEAEPVILAEMEAYDPVEAGRLVYERERCRRCHVIGIDGSDTGPDLTGAGLRLREDFLRAFLVNPQAFFPETEMPPTDVPSREIDELVAYLLSLTGTPQP